MTNISIDASSLNPTWIPSGSSLAAISLWEPTRTSVPGDSHTQFASLARESFDFFATHTGSQAPTAIAGVLVAREVAPAVEEAVAARVEASAAERIANERVRILAAKYATQGKDKEILARLEILNHRLTQRIPTVSAGQVEFLEKVNESVAFITERTEAIAARLGLKYKL